VDKEKLVEMYRTMVRIRAFEERAAKEFAMGHIPGHAHLYMGEEAVAVGACSNLRKDDYVVSTHRGHGHLIAKGGKTDRMMAELFGKSTGYCKGKGGTMHIADTDIGILGANGIVGAGITIAAGAALSAQKRKTDQVTVCFFGDGASNTSRFHEGLNLAACLNLPVVYVLENNGYAISVPIGYACKITNIGDRAAAYGIPGLTIDGNDVLAVQEAIGEAVDRARKGGGPTLIECKTYRFGGHFTGDPQNYRTKEEVAEWLKKDPIPAFRAKLIKMGVLTDADAEDIQQEIDAEIAGAVEFANESPLPAPEETLKDVYTVPGSAVASDEAVAHPEETREITFLQAIKEAVDEEMQRDAGVIVIGEDLKAWGAPRGEFRGLYDKYGADRVIDSPISEAAILGAAVGAAATGMRPLANIMYANFLGVCGDELINQLTKMKYMFGGKIELPVTIMSYSGAGASGGAQHSNTLYGWLMAVTGLQIVVPSNVYDAKGLLKSAIRENNPTIFLYHHMLMTRKRGTIPAEDYSIPLGQAAVKRPGKDVTVVAIGYMVPRALAAAEQLQAEGIDVEVIDPRTLVPLDKRTIIESIKKTRRLVIMDEEPVTGSAAGEIAAIIADEAFAYLEAPIKRVCAPDTPIPFSSVLEQYWIPDETNLMAAVKGII